MDIKFLQTRYDKGKAAVEKLMTAKHRFVSLNCLADLQADLLTFQSESNSSGALLFGLKPQCMVFSIQTKYNAFLRDGGVSRPTLLVLDLSLWPSSRLSARAHGYLFARICFEDLL